MRWVKELLLVGDRVLIAPEEGEQTTETGLYLPPTVKEKEKVLSGYVVKVGPGYAVPGPFEEEPWRERPAVRYVPLQAEEGDYAMFLRDQAVEILYEGKKYFVVPHSAILVLVRSRFESGGDPEP
jgi:chaperonin GroES|nr:MAG: chaperonin [Bacteroidota bacterium]